MGADLSVPWAVRTGTRAPGGPCPDFTSFFTFHSSFSLTASSALPILRGLTRGEVPSGPLCPPRALAASAPLGSAPHAPGGAPVRRAPRPPPPPPQPLPGAGLRSHLPSPAQTSGAWPGPFPLPGAGWGGCSQPRGAGGGVGRGVTARAWGRRAPARATRAAVMATRLLQPRGREPAL